MRALKTPREPIQVTRTEALQCVPAKNDRVEEMRLESGEVLLSYPLEMRPWLAKLMHRLGREPGGGHLKKLQLDELGTSVWDLIDGQRTVHQVIRQFAATFQLYPKEAELSVTRFMRELGKRGLIALK